MTSSTARPGAGGEPAGPVMTLGWTLKRAVIGLVLLIVVVGGTALLLDASIEPDKAPARSDRADAAVR